MSDDKDAQEFLEMLNESMPEGADPIALKYGRPQVPWSETKAPDSVSANVFTKKWGLTQRARKKKRKTSKASRKKNRRKK